MVQIISEEVYAHGFGFLSQDSDIDDADGCLLSIGIKAISSTMQAGEHCLRSCCADVFPH
jgi:hypothetical protein